MIYLKNSKEIELMRQAGRVAALALKKVEEHIKIRVKIRQLDKIAEEVINSNGATASFKEVAGYHHCICATQNDWVVHGIPGEYELKDGDIIGIDLGAYYKGYHSDMAHTYLVGKSPKKEKFLQTGETALWSAIKEAKVGNHIGDISNKIQVVVEGAGYSVVKELVGHGVGKDLHEDPLIPGKGKKGTGAEIEEGMVLAIEVIYKMGSPDITLLSDGWTIATKDGSYSGLF